MWNGGGGGDDDDDDGDCSVWYWQSINCYLTVMLMYECFNKYIETLGYKQSLYFMSPEIIHWLCTLQWW